MIVEVPNYGQVEFPDSMSEEEIVAAIKKTAMGYGAQTAKPLKMGADAFPDALRSVLGETGWGTRQMIGMGTSVTNLWEGVKQLVGAEDKQKIQANKVIREEAPIGSIAGDMALLAAPLAAVTAPLKAGLIGAGYGALQPVADAESWQDVAKGKALSAGVSGLASSGGQLLANKLAGGVSSRLASIEQKVQEKAAQVAASETASARSAAGNAAQNAYRQLEHLRELGANRALTPDELLTVESLERELAEKALDKLMPAAAMKQSTATAYKEAMETEAERAAKYAADKLSNKEIKEQVLARLKRYGPAVAGGMVGNMLFPGLGGAVGGAATGLTLRPAIRSAFNLAKNPAVQHGLLSPLNDSVRFASPLFPASSALAADGLLGLLSQ